MRTLPSPLRLAIIVLAVALLPAQGAYAFCANTSTPASPPPPTPCPKCEPKVCKKCTTSPVFAASGVYETDTTDLSLPTNGFALVASRRYNSTHAIDGPTGFGWSSSFHARLHYTTYLFAAPSTYRIDAEVVMPDGGHYVFRDDGTGHFTPPDGRYDTLIRNIDGTFDLILQRSRSKLRFAADGTLQSVTDDYGNALTYTYDATSGRLQRVSDASGSGRYLDVTWGPNGRISAIQDNSGRTVQYAYNTNGTLASVTNPLGQVTTYTYVTGRFSPVLSQIKDHWSRVLSDLTWDAQGRLASYSEEGETYTYTYAYNNIANQTAKTVAAGDRWITVVDPVDGLITEKRPPGIVGAASSFTTYNSDGTIQLATDEAGVKTSYLYAGLGLIGSVTRDFQGSLAVRFEYTYDPNFYEKVASVIPKNPTTGLYDPNWQGWRYDYYPPGSTAPGALYHVYRVRDDGVTTDLITTYTYNSKGKILTATDALGNATEYAYDSAGNLSTVSGAANNDAGTRPITANAYDAVGRVTSVTDPLGKATSYAYDALDRITSVTLPPPSGGSTLNFTTTYSYDTWDATNSLTYTNVTDPNAILTRQGYDQFGRLRRSIDGLANATGYGYGRNLLTVIVDANGYSTSYEYDALKRLSATVFPDGARETYTYSADGLLKTKTDRKTQTITYTYDAHKRLTTKTYPNATYVQYTYAGQKLTQAYDNSASPAETHTFGYDNSFRVTSNVQAARGTLSYTYTAADAMATSSISGGPTTTYAYYPDGSLNTVGWSPVTGQFKYAYRLNGQYQTLTSPNGQTRTYSYDDQGRLLQITNAHPTAGNLATFDYAYDLNQATGAYDRLDQRVSMTANIPSQALTSALTKYFYDPAYQLNQTMYPAAAPFNGETHAWTYDAIGNRLTSTVNTATASYTYQKIGTNTNNWQRLTSDGTNAYTYDANGNTATRTGSTFGWDYENRLSSIAGGATATYKYDYQGRRASKTAGTTTSYLYDGLNLVSESSAAVTYYLYGPGIDEPLAMSQAGAVSYYSPDGLGSVTGVSDTPGTVQNNYLFDAWGISRTTSETVPQPFRYTGREDGELGTLFYRARFHQPSIGRFLSEDRIRFNSGQVNWYSYVGGDPISFTDPRGLKIEVCCRRVPGTEIVGGKQHCFVRAAPPISTGSGSASSLSGVPNPLVPFRSGRKLCKIRNYGPDAGYSGYNCAESPDTPERRNCLACAFQNFPSGRTYDEYGDNSNTLARSLIRKCGLAAPRDASDPSETPGTDYLPISGCSP